MYMGIAIKLKVMLTKIGEESQHSLSACYTTEYSKLISDWLLIAQYLVRLMTHIARIRGIFDVANSQRYRAGFAPMLFQWSHAHIARFFVAKNRAIKRGLERKNRAIKKSRYVCHGTNRGRNSILPEKIS